MTTAVGFAEDNSVLKAHKLPIGETVGHWLIRERLGRGAVASVYRAQDQVRRHDVALKVLHADPHEEETRSVERLRREIKLAQRIDDPAVCRIFEIEAIDDLLLLVMEFIPGQSLRNLLEDHGQLSPLRAARVAHGIAEGLAAAHDQEILHRDLKPGNIMVRPDDTAAILDFGYAIAPDVTRVTKKGSWVGTLAYAAPELLKNHAATPSSDIYSLGVLLYECLAGEMPFIGHSYGELASAILFRDVVPPSRLAPDLDPRLDAIVLQAMSRDPEERPRGADQVALVLAELIPELSAEEPTLTSIEALGGPEVRVPPPESTETTAVNIHAPATVPEAFASQKTEVDSSPLLEATEPHARVPDVTAAEALQVAPGDEPAASTDPHSEPTQPMIPTPQAAHDRLAVHKKLADLSAALMRERKAKGIILGDDPELDSAEKTAQEKLRQGHWNDTIASLERALAQACAIVIDERFILGKIERFNATMDEKAQPHNLAHFRGLLDRARAALEHGELAAANQTLNHAFDTLRAK